MKFANVITLNNRQYCLELDFCDGLQASDGRDYLVNVACWIEGLGKINAKISPMTREVALEFIYREDNLFVKKFDKKVTKMKQAAVTEGIISVPVTDKTILN